MKLETSELLIRDFKIEDVEQAYEYLKDPQVMKHIETEYTLEQTKEFITECGIKKKLIFALIEKKSSILIGHVIFHPFDSLEEYEIGWIINKSYWGNGYAKEISMKLIQYAQEVLHLKRVIAEAEASNEKSLYIIQTLGMKENKERSGEYLKLYELLLV